MEGPEMKMAVERGIQKEVGKTTAVTRLKGSATVLGNLALVFISVQQSNFHYIDSWWCGGMGSLFCLQ
jgi:hypothetical protein